MLLCHHAVNLHMKNIGPGGLLFLHLTLGLHFFYDPDLTCNVS